MERDDIALGCFVLAEEVVVDQSDGGIDSPESALAAGGFEVAIAGQAEHRRLGGREEGKKDKQEGGMFHPKRFKVNNLGEISFCLTLLATDSLFSHIGSKPCIDEYIYERRFIIK